MVKDGGVGLGSGVVFPDSGVVDPDFGVVDPDTVGPDVVGFAVVESRVVVGFPVSYTGVGNHEVVGLVGVGSPGVLLPELLPLLALSISSGVGGLMKFSGGTQT